MAVRNLIFDFDGTICDSYLESVRVMNELAVQHGFQVVPETELEALKDCNFTEFQARVRLPVHKLPLIVSQGRARMKSRIDRLKPIAGLPEALEELKARGARLGILTSNARENVELFLKANRLELFDFVHGGSSIFGKGPVLKKLVRQLELDPASVDYIGDEARDVKAARKAGTRAVAVTWGFNSPRLLHEAGPDVVLNAPGELVAHALGRP